MVKEADRVSTELPVRESILSKPVIPFRPRRGMTTQEFFQKNSLTGNSYAQLDERFWERNFWAYRRSVPDFFKDHQEMEGEFFGFYHAAKLWDRILDEQRTVFCGAAGAFIPFGGRCAFVSLLENNCIDVLVTTSAQVAHDVVETLGGKHYRKIDALSDPQLADLNINRFYNVLGKEEDYKLPDSILEKLILTLPTRRPITSREYLYFLGQALTPHAVCEGILTTATRKKIPIYCPALGDGVAGTDILELWHKNGKRILIDTVLADELEKMEIVAATEDFGAATSAVFFAGGVVRNNAQQAQANVYAIGRKTKGHLEAIRFWWGNQTDGGLSSSSISEGVTWKKYNPSVLEDDNHAEVFTDSNFAINVIAQLMLELRVSKERRKPTFSFNKDGSLTYIHPNGRRRNLQGQFRRDIGKKVY